jgi:hypothetical protein
MMTIESANRLLPYWKHFGRHGCDPPIDNLFANRALYAASSCNLLPICQEFSLPLKMGPIGSSETLVRNYRYSLRNDTEEHSYQEIYGFYVVWRVRLLSDVYVYCLTCTSIVWRVRLLSDLYVYCLTCTSIVWRVRLLSDVYIYYLTCTSIVWLVRLLSDVYVYCLTCTSIVWRVRLLSDVYVYCLTCTSIVWHARLFVGRQ